MLGLSTLSGLSYGSSSISEDVDLDLVEEIIQRAPRATKTFPSVYRAYCEVLEENGLSQASDTAYYRFLLKLGVIRATTWGERWDAWKATNSIQSRPQSHISPRKARPTSTRAATIKARVPFLASASSDLDEGFEGDGESLMEAESRTSPRKDIKDSRKSLVGHSPSPSVDYDFASLTAPIRTSTPVYARGRGSPTLPPYSVSDVSEVLDFGEDHGTPKATTRQYEVEDPDPDVLRELERRADEFYETGLRGRCWDVWAQASEWVQRTTEQIDTVRSNILLRQTLGRWRAVYQHNLTLPNTADAHRQHHLKDAALKRWIARLKTVDLEKREVAFSQKAQSRQATQSWATWRNRLIKNRTQRWTRDMSSRERAFVARREERLASSALDTWRDHIRDRIDGARADQHYFSMLKRQTIRSWRYATTQRQELATLEAEYETKRCRSSKAAVFTSWKKRSALIVAEKRFDLLKMRRLVGQTWDVWRTAASQRKTALELFERHSVGRAMSKWRAKLARIKALSQQASGVRAEHDQGILREAFGRWIASERSNLLTSVHDTRLTRECITRWRKKREALAGLDAVADEHRRQVAIRSQHSAFSRWRDRLGHRQNQVLQADLIYESRILSKSLRTWSAASKKLESNAIVAHNAHRYFTQRTILRCWKAAFEQKKRDKYIEDRRKADLRALFDRWMEATVQSVQDGQAVDKFQQDSEKRLAKAVLVKWTARVVAVKSLELDVIEQRDDSLLRDAMSRWRTSSKRVNELKGLMHSFKDVKLEDSLRHVLRVWHTTAVESRERRIRLAQAERERDDLLKKYTFDHWRSRYRENQLAPLEEEVALRREDAVIFTAWDTWKARSKKLQAVSFEHRRIKKIAMSRWIRASMLATQAKQAKATADRHLIEDIFATWKDAAKRKSSLRTTRIRGRIRPTAQPSDSRRVSEGHPPRMITPHRNINEARLTPSRTVRSPSLIQGSQSAASEPAYSRLRSELASHRRGGSEEPEEGSGMMRALRGALGDR